jgi:hypothetical protein
VCENFWDVLVGDTNNGHAVGIDGASGLMPENAGNEKFLTDADLDNDDQQQNSLPRTSDDPAEAQSHRIKAEATCTTHLKGVSTRRHGED